VSPAQPAFPHVVIRASAGTGKTFQLSNRFLGLIAASEPLDTILATTFTRKAAGEILDRVLTRLAEAACDDRKRGQLADSLGAGTMDASSSLGLLRAMVRHLHRLRVGTLDSFFIQVARSFSLELGLPPGWQIVDEVMDRRLRAEAVRAVLREEATSDVVALMNLLTKGEATRSVSEQIRQLVDDLYQIFVEAPAAAWQALVRHKELPDEQLRHALDALEAVEIPKGNRSASAREKDLACARSGDWLAFLEKGLPAKILQGDNTYYNKPIPEDLIAAYDPLIAHAKAVVVGRIANQTDATHRLLERFDEAYQRLKTAQRALRFEDVTRKLGQQWVADRIEDTAFRLDAHLSHLLLDEFQDTSPLQWRVLRPFARQAIDGGARRSFFCVGDVKQAIYGWRGGVAEIFEAIGEDLPHLQPASLTKSWRSCQAVIDTVNRVFENLKENQVLQRHETAAAKWASRFEPHTTARTELAGHCRLRVAPEAADGEEQSVATLRFAAAQVAELHRQAPGCTIGVLVRRNSAVARTIFELRRLGIEASEEGGNPLTDSPAVQVVLSLVRLADHPGDRVARYHAAHTALGESLGLKKYDDDAAAWRGSCQIRERLMTFGYGPTLFEWAKILAADCDRRDLNRLMQLVGLAYTYKASARADDFVELVEQQRVEDPTSAPVRVMTVHQSKGLQFDIVFLPELDAGLGGQFPNLVVGRPKPTDDVECVCRYVAKNLRPLLPHKFSEMFDHHECQVVEESLCVLYVALTRAIHALHMIVAPSKPNEKTLPCTSAGLLRFALADGARAEPGTVLYEHGRRDWAEPMATTKPSASPLMPATDKLSEFKLQLASPGSSIGARGLDRQSPSQMEGGKQVDLKWRLRLDAGAALDRGTLMHAWFEAIEWLDDGRPDRAKLMAIAELIQPGGADASALIEPFERILQRPAIQAVLSRASAEQQVAQTLSCKGVCFSGSGSGVSEGQIRVWRERPFACREGDIILNGKIDRLVVFYHRDRPLAAEVVDFKTDRLSADDPASIDARLDFYRPQLEAYRRASARLLGLELAQISAKVAFVEAGVVREV